MENDNNTKKSKLSDPFDLKEAINDVSFAFGAKDTLGAGAKLLGKSIFNAGLFTGKLAIGIVKELPGTLANQAQKTLNERNDLTSEQKIKLEGIVSKGNSLTEKIKE